MGNIFYIYFTQNHHLLDFPDLKSVILNESYTRSIGGPDHRATHYNFLLQNNSPCINNLKFIQKCSLGVQFTVRLMREFMSHGSPERIVPRIKIGRLFLKSCTQVKSGSQSWPTRKKVLHTSMTIKNFRQHPGD